MHSSAPALSASATVATNNSNNPNNNINPRKIVNKTNGTYVSSGTPSSSVTGHPGHHVISDHNGTATGRVPVNQHHQHHHHHHHHHDNIIPNGATSGHGSGVVIIKSNDLLSSPAKATTYIHQPAFIQNQQQHLPQQQAAQQPSQVLPNRQARKASPTSSSLNPELHRHPNAPKYSISSGAPSTAKSEHSNSAALAAAVLNNLSPYLNSSHHPNPTNVLIKKTNSLKQALRPPITSNSTPATPIIHTIPAQTTISSAGSASTTNISAGANNLNASNISLNRTTSNPTNISSSNTNLYQSSPIKKRVSTNVSTGSTPAISTATTTSTQPTINSTSPIPLQHLTQSPSASQIRSRARSKSNQVKSSTPLPSSPTKATPRIINNSSSTNNNTQHTNNLKKTLENIELKMRIIASPNIRIADLFKCFLKNVPKSTETIESLVHYGDNIGAKIVKCLINENLYESQSLINQDYDIYQGPALCVTYDAILKEEHWDEIFICSEDDCLSTSTSTTNGGSTSKLPHNQYNNKSSSHRPTPFSSSKLNSSKTGANSSNDTSSSSQQASKFISFFHISDFIAILSGYKVAFVDPYERFAPDERSYVAIFDLEHDTHDIEQFEDQFKPLEKIFNVPLLKNRYYNGTIIRLPLRTQTSTCSVSNKLVHVKDILINAKDFMKEAHLHILFSKNISNIQFCRTKDSQNIEKIYSINVEDSCMEQFKQKYKKISDAIADGEFPRTSTVIITLRKQIETKIEKTEWILSIFADTMRLLNSNYFLMKLAIPISDNCDKDLRFSHKSNLISSDTGFIKTLYLTKPIICYIEDKEGILMSHFCRLNISDSLKLSHFNDAYALMLKDLTKIIRKDPSLLWSLMPDLDKNTEFTELLGEIWQEIAKHELFYSCTEGWGYVAIEDMIINDVEDQSVLQEILTKVYSETNYPVVIMPNHVLKALQKYSPKDSLQIMTPSQTSDILHNNQALIEQLKPHQKIELLRYLIKEPITNAITSSSSSAAPPSSSSTVASSSSAWPTSAARYIFDLPLLLLANNKFIRFQAPSKVKSVYLVEKEYMPLFNSDSMQLSQFINPDFPKDLMQILKKFEFQRLTQVQMISDSELNELINVPKEWRNGEEKILWPKSHDKYNIEWLETLWKYLCEHYQNDLTMMENLNIIYTIPNKFNELNSAAIGSTGPSATTISANAAASYDSKNLILFKLSKNSNLVYTPPYTHNDSDLLINSTITTTTTSTTNAANSHQLADSNQSTTTSSSTSISEETYALLLKILNKLGFQCIESISTTILSHPLFLNYVPNLKKSRLNLLRAFRNKYKHASIVKITQDFNALLNESDIKLLQQYLSKIELPSNLPSVPINQQKSQQEEQSLLEILKELPIFENSALECSDRYLPLKEASLIYDTPIRLPFELTGIKPFIFVQENETKLLIIEKLHLNLVKDFSVIIKEIIKYCTSKELNSLSAYKVHSLGKWLLLNCASYLLANINNYNSSDNNNTEYLSSSSRNHRSAYTNSKQSTNNLNTDLIECIKNAKLFMNQNQELCAPTQFINPLFKERFISILDPKWIPAKDLVAEEKCINILKELKMRNCLQLKVDEIIDLYEHSIKQNDQYRRLLAELIIDILVNRLQDTNTGNLDSNASIDKALNEYSTTKAVTLRHFLMSVNWIPLQRERPQSYPQSLFWKGAESLTSSTGVPLNPMTPLPQSAPTSTNERVRFSSPRDCVDSQFAYCAGSVASVSDLEIPTELKVYIDLKQVHLDVVVRHLKLTTRCFDSSALKVEWYDYLTVAKRCYEFMSAFEPQEIFRELKANDLTDWIWNGAGFSSINSIFIITEKDHPLCSHVAILPYELYVFVKFFERLGIKKQPDSKQLESIVNKCLKNSQKLTNGASPMTTNKAEQSQHVLENAAKNYPLINWIKSNYSTDKRLLSIIKEYEENLIGLSSMGNGTNGSPIAPFLSAPNGTAGFGSPSNGRSSNNDLRTSPASTPGLSTPLRLDLNEAAMAAAVAAENSSDHIFLYLPELYKSMEIKDNLINSVMTLVKNRQIKILDEEAYLMRKVAVAAAAAANTGSNISPTGSSSKNQSNNIYDHYRVYNEIILPNLNSLSKNVKDSVVLFALDHADPKMLEILRDHPCIPASPYGRKLKKPNKLVHPMGKIAPLFSEADERFPHGSEETYIREDRLQILKILGMRCDYLSWHELVERAESVSTISDYDQAVDRSITILSVLNEMITNSGSNPAGTPTSQSTNINAPFNQQSNKYMNGTNGLLINESEEESKQQARESMKNIPFIPVKSKPYNKIKLAWFGDKLKYRFVRPKELLSSSYEYLCSSLWPIPLNEFKKKENFITKQLEQFLGIDDLNSKFHARDALKHIDEVSKINIIEIDDSKEAKLITDICYQIYEYLQTECQKKPNEIIPIVREFFADRRCVLINEEFVNINQLCWQLNANLKPMFYQIPNSYARSFKYFFNQVLNVRLSLDLPDLLHVVDTIKKKYKELSISNRDDFNILMSVYGLIIDQGYQIITNLYLPNINGVLQPGRLLYFNPMTTDQLDRPEEYVHPAVDRRICVIAGVSINKKLSNPDQIASMQTYHNGHFSPNGNAVTSTSLLSLQNINGNSTPMLSSPNGGLTNGRIFPRVFGNKRLEGILARLDDDKIDINLINNMDEGNPQIILDYLLEANRIHSLSAFLSEDDIFVIFKYFNDFLARNYQAGTFQRLKELKVYKPLWSEKYINLNFTGSSLHPLPTTPINLTSISPLNTNLNSMVPNVYLISEEMASLMKRSFKVNPFIQKAGPASPVGGQAQPIIVVQPTINGTDSAANNNNSPFIIIIRRNELAKLYSHLNLLNLNDLEAFLHLCLPQFRKLDAKCQNNFLKYLYDEILEKSYIHEKEKCFKILREKLYIQTRKGDMQLISDLYDMKSEPLKHILNDSYFPDENFDSPQCLRFLKEAGLRTYLPSETCKRCMNEIENKVTGDSTTTTSPSIVESGWTDELRARSKWLYLHLVENWQRYDDSVLQQRFLEPYCPDKKYVTLKTPFEYSEFNKTCLKLSDAELQKYEYLVWSSSYILPSFVNVDSLDANTIEFLKLNRKPCFALVNQHLNNICESVSKKSFQSISSNDDENNGVSRSETDEVLIESLGKIYQYLDDLNINEHHKDMYKQLEDKEIVWSASSRKFVSPNKICIQLDQQDEIPPFIYALTPALRGFKSLLLRLGSKDKPYPMLYGDILRKMAKVCGDDYLNSNELCKAIKAMECFFKYLKLSANNKESDNSSTNGSSPENVSSQYKLPGLYFVTTELKLEKSSAVVILDNRENLDDIAKLPQDKFVFNPSEKVFKMNTAEIKPLIDKIFISQRPTLFSQKYEATYDFTLPDDPDSQRQNLLTSLERKYQQIFTSRQLHRCLARCISNEEARRSSPKHLPIDEVEKVIRERLSSIKVTCVEYLETSLSYRKLSQQQKLEQTVEEKACYLTHESLQFATLYVSKKHIEQPYFALCLARSLQPLLMDLHFDYSIFTSLIATSVSQMSRLLQLVNVATEENILSVIKLQYVPSSGKLYGDDVNLLAPYDTKLHHVLIGDLCVFANADGTYIYCQVIKILSIKKSGSDRTKTSKTSTSSDEDTEYEFVVQIDDTGNQTVKISQKDLYVLENWHRIYDAMTAKPTDERESFKYQENSSSSKAHTNGNGHSDQDSGSGKRTSGEGEENFSSNASDSDRSDSSSNFGSNDYLPNSIEIEQAKTEVNNELRLLWGLEENDRKKKINRLLLKWHPDKNPGKEKFASEVFKHLKKQIELYKTDPFLAGFYRSTYSSYGGFSSSTAGSSAYGTGASGTTSSGTTGAGTDDFKSSRHYGSYDDLHRKGSPGSGGSPHSSPSRDGPGMGSSTGSGYDYEPKGPGASNLGRAGSFRQEWERRRQQKRQTAGADPRDRSSPSSARRRGTDFTQMDASLWFTQAKCDLDSANNDMHPITGKPAYEWVCYKCYRAVEKALRAYHYFKGNGKLPASDIHGLLLGVETNIRDIAFRFCNFIGNEANSMQYPGIARFGKTPNEVFPLTKAEQALDYGKELLKLVEDVIYAN